MLPLAQYLNGHTYFVQHAHTLPNAATPISVHMTYQFAEGSKFAYGKRQRLREAGLWLVDEDSYYNGRYVTAASLGANLPLKTMGPRVDSRDAVKYHLAEATRRAKIIRALLGVAKVALLTAPSLSSLPLTAPSLPSPSPLLALTGPSLPPRPLGATSPCSP